MDEICPLKRQIFNNSSRTSKGTHRITVTKYSFQLFGNSFAVYSQNKMKPVTGLCGRQADLH
jgi:hypothetical protein